MSAPSQPARAHLVVVAPDEQRGRSYELLDELTVGRAAGCHIALDDRFVSQLHARMFRRDDQCFIEDLGSTNGTFLNDEKVTSPALLTKGDHVRIGNVVMELAVTSFVWGAATDVGRVRHINQDSLVARFGLFAVADGMGGHTAGEVAAEIAVEVFETHPAIVSTQDLIQAVHAMNAAIMARAEAEPDAQRHGHDAVRAGPRRQW